MFKNLLLYFGSWFVWIGGALEMVFELSNRIISLRILVFVWLMMLKFVQFMFLQGLSGLFAAVASILSQLGES